MRDQAWLDHFADRAVADAIASATAAQWLRRAAVFEAAAHRPRVDFPGRASRAQLGAQAYRCRLVARACRNHAWLIERGVL